MKIIKKVKNPKFLVITPLRISDSISENTLSLLNTTKTEFDWISYSGNNNIPKNTQLALNEYEENIGNVDYLIKVDNDITPNSNFLDSLYNILENSNDNIAYSYCSFEFSNEKTKICINAFDFDELQLLNYNYISSISMIKRNALKEIGDFIYDDQYVRLLDYALWLKFLSHNYIGIYDKNTYFKAELNENSISAGSSEDYELKMSRIKNDFILPYIRGKYGV